MNHQLTLPEQEYNATDVHLIVKLPLAEKWDQVTLTKEGTREQKIRYITRVIKEGINRKKSLFLLTDIRPLIDDIPASVGGGPGVGHVLNEDL